jgi:DNA-binding transcriptional MerR regulator
MRDPNTQPRARCERLAARNRSLALWLGSRGTLVPVSSCANGDNNNCLLDSLGVQIHGVGMASGFKLDELASRAGVSPRTIRYYIQRGVLPAAEFRGPDTTYDERHLQALRAIKRLQEDYLPLDAIAAAIAGKSAEELRYIASRGLEPLVDPRSNRTLTRAALDEESAPPLRAVRGERIKLADHIELWTETGADRALIEAIIELAQKKARKA